MKALVLMYHRVAKGRSPDRYTVSAAEFALQMQHLADAGFRVVDMPTIARGLDGSMQLPERTVTVTFDDGFRETHECATPVLTRLGFSATHFVVSGLVGRSNEWMARDPRLRFPLMRWSDLFELREAGFEVGSHTVTHPVLPEIEPARAMTEISDSKKNLEDRLGTRIRYFAYPFGRFDQRITEMVKSAGYEAACSTLSGFASVAHNRYEIRRVEVFGNDTLRAFGRKIEFGANEVRTSDVLRYYARRAFSRIAN